MNFKKVLAGVAAGSMVAAMSVTAFAEQVTLEATYNSTDLVYTVEDDITTLSVQVTMSSEMKDAADPDWNDWCGATVKVTLSDGTVNYYQYGGASVTWDGDFDGDEESDSIGGVNGDTWVGTLTADGGTLSIPVDKGAVVEFNCQSWDSAPDLVQYTLTMGEAEATGDVAPVAYLAAVVALAGVAMVASKKARA